MPPLLDPLLLDPLLFGVLLFGDGGRFVPVEPDGGGAGAGGTGDGGKVLASASRWPLAAAWGSAAPR